MTENQEAVPNTPVPVSPEPNLEEPAGKPHRSRLWLVILISISTLFLFTALAYWFGTRQPSPTNPPNPSVAPVLPSIASATPTLSPPESPPFSPTPSDITWYSTPKQIAALSLFKTPSPDNNNYFIPGEAKYSEVGTMPDGTKIINVHIPVNAPSPDPQLLRILQDSQGKLTLIVPKSDSTWLQDSLSNELLPGIEITSQTLSDLEAPDSLTAGNLSLVRAYSSGQKFSDLTAPEKIADTEFGPLYKLYTPITDTQTLKARKLVLKLPDSTVAIYTLKNPFMADDRVPQLTWEQSGYQNIAFTQTFIPSCSSGMFSTVPVMKNQNLNFNKTLAGKSSSGVTVYALTDSHDAFMSDIYGLYRTGRDYEGATNLKTLDEFSALPTHFLWQDSLGDWQVFVSNEFAPAAECGKPVIYLYPEKTTPVNLKVGAQIRLSDPLYPPGGWQVIAHPNGQLDYEGQTYSSLFWEGLGSGPYPDYRDSGVVISQKDLLSTLTNQLSQLGLNTAESQDFLAFWLDKFPNTPFIRLTWLGTTDMDRLAPLTVSPKPDTRIRIFLEFAGLDQPIPLKPQKLSAPARRGFTLVEWGGLLTKSH